MKYFFVSLILIFFLFSISYGLNPPTVKDSVHSSNPKSKEKNFGSFALHTPENSPIKPEENNVSPQPGNRIERSGQYLIGSVDKKHSQQFDRRYFVYENRLQNDGTLKPVRVASVKSMKSPYIQSTQPDNRYRTAFYQISGKRSNVHNAFLERADGKGFNLIAGKTFNGLSAATGRLEYYFSRNMGDMILPGKAGKGLTSVKIYFEGGQKKHAYVLNSFSENFTFTRGSLGIGKDYYPLPFIHWGPFAGYGLEYTKWGSSDNLISTNFAEMGARLGINIFHNFQVIGSATYYLLINSVQLDGNKNVLEPKFDYIHIFTDRYGFGYSFALRLML